MKNRLKTMLPCIALLVLFTSVHFNYLRIYYDELLNSSGIVNEDFEKELKEENDRAIENEKEYQKLLHPSEVTQEKEEQEETPAQIKKLKLHARASLLLDASNNRVLYEVNGNKELPMASTTKIMTCIVALENSKPDEVVTVSSYAQKMPDVQLNIREGEQYYLKDLLYSLMLESHNDTAVAIAEHVGGSVEGFATMMNDKARELHCEHTNFITPNGLDAAGHYTTARDLAIIASYAIKNQKFLEITNASTHEFKEIKSGRSFRVTNKDRFLYLMEGAIGIKTGFTNDAGYCFVGAIKRLDRTLVSVVLGCGWPPRKSLKWSDTKELMNYGINNYEERQIFEDTKLNPVLVKDGQQKYETLKLEGNLTLLMRKDEKVEIAYDIPKELKAPVKAGSIVGNAVYYIDGVEYTRVPIYSTQDVLKIDFRYCLQKLFRFWSLQY